MKTAIISMWAVAVTAVPAFAETVTKSHDFGRFEEISASSGIEVVFEPSDTQSVEIEAERTAFDTLVVKVEDGTLVLRRRGMAYSSGQAEPVVAHVTAPALEEVDLSSAAQFSATALTADSFEAELSSMARLELVGAVIDEIEIEASSSAMAVLDGECGEIEIEASSGANIDAVMMSCEEAELEASSGATVTVFARDTIAAEASSGAEISYAGRPDVRAADTSSGGAIAPLTD